MVKDLTSEEVERLRDRSQGAIHFSLCHVGLAQKLSTPILGWPDIEYDHCCGRIGTPFLTHGLTPAAAPKFSPQAAIARAPAGLQLDLGGFSMRAVGVKKIGNPKMEPQKMETI